MSLSSGITLVSYEIVTSPTDRVGKYVKGAIYLHVSALAEASQAIRDRVQRAVLASGCSDWNVAKVEAEAVSLLTYEAFDEAAFPALLAAVRLNLSGAIVTRIDYRKRANPPILHRKEILLRSDDPRRPAFAALTRLAEEHKLFNRAAPHWHSQGVAGACGGGRSGRAGRQVAAPRGRACGCKCGTAPPSSDGDLSQPVQMLVLHRIVTESTGPFSITGAARAMT